MATSGPTTIEKQRKQSLPPSTLRELEQERQQSLPRRSGGGGDGEQQEKQKRKDEEEPPELSEEERAQAVTEAVSELREQGELTDDQLQKLEDGTLRRAKRDRIVDKAVEIAKERLQQKARKQRVKQSRQKISNRLKQSITKETAREALQRRGELQAQRRQSLTQEGVADVAASNIEAIQQAEQLEQERRQSVPLREAEQSIQRQQLEQERQQSITQQQAGEILQEQEQAQQRQQPQQFSVTLQSAEQAPAAQQQIRQAGGEVTDARLVGTAVEGTTQAAIQFRARPSQVPEFEFEESAQEIGARQRAREVVLRSDPVERLGITTRRVTTKPFESTGVAIFEPEEGRFRADVADVADIIEQKQRRSDVTITGLEAGEALVRNPGTQAAGGFLVGRGVQAAGRLATRTRAGRFAAQFLTGTPRGAKVAGLVRGGTAAGVGGAVAVGETQRVRNLQQQLEQGDITQGEFAGKIAGDIAAIGASGAGVARGLRPTREQVFVGSSRVQVAQQAQGRRLQPTGKPQPLRREIQTGEIQQARFDPVLQQQRVAGGQLVTRGRPAAAGEEVQTFTFFEGPPTQARRVAQQRPGEFQELLGARQPLEAPSEQGRFFLSQAGEAELTVPGRTSGALRSPFRTRSTLFQKPEITGGPIDTGIPRPQLSQFPLVRQLRRRRFREVERRIDVENQLSQLTQPRQRPTRQQRPPRAGEPGADVPSAQQLTPRQFFGQSGPATPEPIPTELPRSPSLVPSRLAAPQPTAATEQQGFTGVRVRREQPAVRDTDATVSAAPRSAQRPTAAFNIDVASAVRPNQISSVVPRVAQRQRQPQRKRPRQRRQPFVGPQIRVNALPKTEADGRVRPLTDVSLRTQPRPPRQPRTPTRVPPVVPSGGRKRRPRLIEPTQINVGRKQRKTKRKIFFSDPLSVAVSRARFGQATSPRNVPNVISQARSTAFLRVPTVEQRRSRRKRENNRFGGFI